MKNIIAIIVLCVSLNAFSQKSHSEILNMTKEIKIIDRLYLDMTNLDKTELDELTAHKLFRKFYGGIDQLPNDTKYYISGKITRHPDFDLLFLYAEKNTSDSAKNFDLVLLTTRKDGTYISMIDGASDNYYIRDNKMQHRKTRSYLYNSFTIKQENEISAISKKYEAEYRINEYGMIVFYPKS